MLSSGKFYLRLLCIRHHLDFDGESCLLFLFNITHFSCLLLMASLTMCLISEYMLKLNNSFKLLEINTSAFLLVIVVYRFYAVNIFFTGPQVLEFLSA